MSLLKVTRISVIPGSTAVLPASGTHLITTGRAVSRVISSANATGIALTSNSEKSNTIFMRLFLFSEAKSARNLRQRMVPNISAFTFRLRTSPAGERSRPCPHPRPTRKFLSPPGASAQGKKCRAILNCGLRRSVCSAARAGSHVDRTTRTRSRFRRGQKQKQHMQPAGFLPAGMTNRTRRPSCHLRASNSRTRRTLASIAGLDFRRPAKRRSRVVVERLAGGDQGSLDNAPRLRGPRRGEESSGRFGLHPRPRRIAKQPCRDCEKRE